MKKLEGCPFAKIQTLRTFEMSETIVDKTSLNIPQLLRANDVARMLSVSRSFAYQLMERGELPTVRIGHALRVRIQDLEAFIEASLVQAQKFK